MLLLPFEKIAPLNPQPTLINPPPHLHTPTHNSASSNVRLPCLAGSLWNFAKLLFLKIANITILFVIKQHVGTPCESHEVAYCV